MTQYSKKTCNSCGIRLPQPEMKRVNKKVRTGSSNTGLTKRALLGTAVGNKKSARSVGKFFFSPSKRNYKSNREVWMCKTCAPKGSPVLTLIFWGIILSGVYFWFF
jgi:hypothetical protein